MGASPLAKKKKIVRTNPAQTHANPSDLEGGGGYFKVRLWRKFETKKGAWPSLAPLQRWPNGVAPLIKGDITFFPSGVGLWFRVRDDVEKKALAEPASSL